MKALVALGFFLITGSVFAQTSGTLVSTQTDQAISRLLDELIDSLGKKDLEGVLMRLDTNVVVTWLNGEVSRGREGVREFYKKMVTGEQPIVLEGSAKPELSGYNAYGEWAV